MSNPKIPLDPIQIAELKAEGLIAQEIAERFHISRSTLMRRMREMGLTVCNNKVEDYDERQIARYRSLVNERGWM